MKPRKVRRTGSLRVIALTVAGFLAVAATGLVLANTDQTKNPRQPDAGMTDAQRSQLYQSGRAESDARYQKWLSSLHLAAIKYDSLPHVELLGLWDAAQPSIRAAKAHAQVIVVANATKLQPTAFSGSFVTLQTEQVIKGGLTSGSSLVIHQGGGLRPTEDWSGVEIADAPNEPLILPGHRVLLFLFRSHAGYWEVQGFSGWYALEAGQVRPLAMNPFAAEIRGRLEADVTRLIVSTRESA